MIFRKNFVVTHLIKLDGSCQQQLYGIKLLGKMVMDAFRVVIPIIVTRLGAADVFLEIVTQPFLGFDGIVPGSSSPATV